MMTRPEWNDVAARWERPTSEGPEQDTEESAPVSVQRCLAVTGPQRPTAPLRAGVRTQLGMPALSLPATEPPASKRRQSSNGGMVANRDAGSVSAHPRHLPPPLPARFSAPKVVVAPAPLLPATQPAQRRLLSIDTTEIDAVELLPPVVLPALPSRQRAAAPPPRRRTRSPRGVRGLVTELLVRLLGLVAPSLQVQPTTRNDGRTQQRRR